MSAISDYAAKQKQYNQRMETAIGGIAGDVKTQNEIIQKLQNSPGAVSAEDQVLLDELQANGESLASRLEAVDALTPPAVPGESGAPEIGPV